MKHFAKLRDENIYVFDEEKHIEERYEALPANIYTPVIIESMLGSSLHFKKIENNSLVVFKDGLIKDICNIASKFFTKESVTAYKELDIPHRLGILLHGPTGTGKTSTVVLAMRELIKDHNALCFDFTKIHPSSFDYVIERVRKFQDNPIVILIDEFDNFTKGSWEDSMLTFLDGINSKTNILTIGCTNHLDKIPKRFRERKSRIKHVIEINSLSTEVLKEYISKKLPNIDSKLLSKFAFLASEKNLTIDELKNAIIDYRIDNIELEKAIDLAKKYTKT